MPKPLLDSAATAEILRVSRRTLERWRSEGRHLPYVKCGNQVRYRREDLDAFIANSTRKVACQ